MAIGNSNISISLIKSTLGLNSNSLGQLIGSAASGGVSGYAFYLFESRASNAGRYDGSLIPSARPNWNIFSRRNPGLWFNDNGALNFQLVPDGNNQNGGYCFMLHKFVGYNHSAAAPQFSAASSYNAVDGAVTISFILHLQEIMLPAEFTHLLAEVSIGSDTKQILVEVDTINYTQESVASLSTSFTGVTTTSGTISLWGSNAAGQKLMTLGILFSNKTFSVVLTTSKAYLSRLVGAPADDDVMITGLITVPSGSGSIQYNAGTTLISGITIRFTGISSMYSSCSFDLFLTRTGGTAIYIGNFTVTLSTMGVQTSFALSSIAISPAIAGSENFAFLIDNLTY